MPMAVERIVVQATPEDKRSIVEKARRLELPVSELMRRSALAYEVASDGDLEALAAAAHRAADRAGEAIDDALAFIEASNRRLAVMEPEAKYVVQHVEGAPTKRSSSARAGVAPAAATRRAKKG